MERDEVKRLRAELLKSVESGRLDEFLGRVVSHIESEEGTLVRLGHTVMQQGRMITQHDRTLYGDRDNIEEHPGIAITFAAMRLQQKRNAKLLWTVLAGVATTLSFEVVKWVAGKI